MKFTGVVCPSCKEPVARIEYETPTSMTFHCAACGRHDEDNNDDFARPLRIVQPAMYPLGRQGVGQRNA